MSSLPPHTPKRVVASPSSYTFSPSPSSYLSYAFQPCSSPSPFPASDTHVQTEISPRRYQLVHSCHTSSAAADASKSKSRALLDAAYIPSSTTVSPSSLHQKSDLYAFKRATSSDCDAPDASCAFRSGFRSFGTISAAETLLSVQLGSSPPKFCLSPVPCGIQNQRTAFDDDKTPSTSTNRLLWSPVKLTSSALTSPSSQHTRSRGARGDSDIGHGCGGAYNLFSPPILSPSQEPSSSQPTIASWEGPRTPSRPSKGDIAQRHPANCVMLSSSPRTEDPLSPIFRHDYGCTSNAPRTPQRLRVYSSPSAFFEPNYEFAYPVDLCDPNTLQLSTPECLRTAMLEDDSPILRQGKQGRDIIPQAAAIHPPEEYLSDRDSESGLYASQSGSQSSISRSSSLCTSQKYGDVVSDDELPLAVTRSNLSFLTVKSQQIHPSSSSFKDRRILNNPSTALTGVRARAAQDQRAILPASPWSSPPSASAKENGAKGDIRQTTAVGPQFDTGSPLSSAPSSPGGDSVQKQRGVDSIFSTLGASPIGGRPTRAQIRALAEVLRPCQAGADTESRNNPLRRKRGREGLLSEPYEEKHEKGRKRMKVSPAIAMHMHTGNEENAETFSDCETQLYEEDENTGRNLSRRTFPSSIPVHPLLSALYRKFAVPKDKSSAASLPGAIKNIPRSPMDLYIPRWVKGRGTTKVGLCPICAEPPSRGGEGKKLWLSMKFSAFNYHMQYYHGISPSTGLPFSPPVAFHRIPNVPHSKQGIKVKQEKAEIEQGKCHKCKKWVAVEGVKDVEVKVKEIFWWKHAATCHQRSIIPGEEDVFIDDDVYRAARAAAEDDANQDANTEPAVDH